jgi:Flp pilus assembly protein TadD
LDPNTQIGILLAKAATHSGKCDQAVALLKRISDSALAEPETLYLLSRAYTCAGETNLAEQAQADFETRSTKTREARTQKVDADHLAAQAGELARKNQLSPALELLNQALAKDPSNGPSYGVLAKIDFSRADISKAREEISTALRLDPYNPDYLYVFGKILEKQADLKGALLVFHEATLVAPNESDTYFEISQIYLQLDQRTRAVQALKKAVELSPEDPDYRKALSKLNRRKVD